MRRLLPPLALLLALGACGGGSAEAFCADVALLGELDVEEVTDEEALAVFDRLEASAPREIRDEMRLWNRFLRELVAWAEEGDLSAPPPDFEEAEVRRAVQRIEAFVEEECEPDLG